MIYLLDVNVLLAMSYAKHVHHTRAERWLDSLQTNDVSVNLATCSITELGFVRIACSKADFAESVRVAQEDLKRLKTEKLFIFLDDGLGANRLPRWVERPKHVTDGHLLELASVHRGPLVTLDEGIPGALLIPEQPVDPLVVKEPRIHYGIAAAVLLTQERSERPTLPGFPGVGHKQGNKFANP
jgi:predicted nucleic acid-binding protein